MTQNKLITQKVTVDDLAVMIAKGFRDTDTKILSLRNEMNERFEQVDKRFEQVDKHFEQIDRRFEQMDARFDRLESRFDSVEKTVFNDHGRRIRKIETKLQIA